MALSILEEQRELPFSEEVTGEVIADTNEERLIAAAERVRLAYKGLRVTMHGLPQSRKVTHQQKKAAAQLFQASERSISMSTLLWDADEPLVKDLRSVMGSISRTFNDRSRTLPTTTAGLRKVKKECAGLVHAELTRLKAELKQKAEALKLGLPGVLSRLRGSRAELFSEDDYKNFDPVRDIDVSWSFPVVTEDAELAELDDSVYQHEVSRVRKEGVEAIRRFEDQLAEGMITMLDEIVERLEGTNDGGKRKTFRDATPLKIFEELEMYNTQLKDLGIGGETLGKAFKRLNKVIAGQSMDTFPDALRKGPDAYRETVRENFSKIRDNLLKEAVPVQRRSLLRTQAKRRREG